MRLNTDIRPVISSGTMEVAKATIKSSRKVFDMFSDQTYGNKPVAICRELVANGIDAHIAAGTPDVPVEVTMPTELEPEFKVKDQGIGMAHEFVMGPFMAYTDGSTKDQSNDQIGGFGIGSKSPFAYCDQFTLRVVHDGVLSVYTMFKDEEGIPSIGLQGQSTTDEHNGVEVSFPVEADDMEDFRSAAQTALQYFYPLPTVHNGELSPPDYSHVSSTGKWAMRPQSGPLGVIMGGVRYPVNTDSLPWSVRRDEKTAPLLDYGIDLTLPIGACDVAMSREALSYTDRTSASIVAALGDIVDEVAATFATLFDKYATKWEAQVGLWKELSNLSAGRSFSYNTGGRVGMLRAYAKYKGQKLDADIDLSIPSSWDHITRTRTYTPPKGYPKGAQGWAVIEYSHRQTFPTPKWQEFGSTLTSLTPGAYLVVFVDDMPIVAKSRIRARVQEYLEKHHDGRTKQSLVLRAGNNTDTKSIDRMLAFLGKPQNVVRLSTLPEPSRNIAIRTADGTVKAPRPKVRMFKFNGANDTYGNTIQNLSPAYSKRQAVTEIPYADQPDEGILVVLDAWSFPKDFRKKMKTGVVKWDELFFVNTSDGPKLKGSKFQPFDDVFGPRFEKEKAKYPELPNWLYMADNDDLKSLFHEISRLREWLPSDPKLLKGPFGKAVQLYDRYVVPLTHPLRAFATNADIKPKKPAGVDTKAIADAFLAKQPFAKQVLDLIRYYDESAAKLVVNNL